MLRGREIEFVFKAKKYLQYRSTYNANNINNYDVLSN